MTSRHNPSPDTVPVSDNTDPPKPKKSSAEARREYQRRYYQLHKEKAKEYQRQYNLKHKKKARGGRGKSPAPCPREVLQMTFNPADIMSAPAEQVDKILHKITKGGRSFTR